MTDVTTLNGEMIAHTRPRRGYGRWLAAVLLVALLALLAWGLRLRAASPVESGPAPGFTLTTFDGETIALSELRGQVVIVNFGASWCPPCRDEAPYLEATWRKYRDRGVVLIGVDYVDAEPNALAYLEEFDITYPNGPDVGQKISQAYHVKGVPETFYVDKQGQLRGLKIGPLSPPELDDVIETLLAE
ncbi:MAG: TlpA family protein disulfide reductase [Anaerolineae bacterium]|nr:MAG: TlpA family protein disulfide reductase [Anaerolineae bacterium]